MVKRKVDESGTYHAAGRCHQRIDGFTYGMEIAAWEETIHDLDGNDSEKEDHENVICQEVKTESAQEGTFKEASVIIWCKIGPEQCDYNTAQKRDGEFSQQIDAVFHGHTFAGDIDIDRYASNGLL